MPWKTQDTMSLKREFIMLATKPGANKRELMRRFNISATTGYKWLRRHSLSGDNGLLEQSRRPKSRPGNQTSPAIEQEILSLKRKYPYWGARKLRGLLRDKKARPAISTVHEILRRHNLVGLDDSGTPSPYQRFNRTDPNDLWQMDYKGHFSLSTGQRCHPLTVCDDHSRFNLVLAACLNEQSQTVRYHLRDAFERYGLPRQILCDNGSPWGCGLSNATGLYVWLIEIGVEMIHGRIYHPQTQGKEERFHRTIKHELLSRTTVWRDINHCAVSFKQWRHQYNYVRPHEAIDDKTQSEVYQASKRSYPDRIQPSDEYYLEEDIKRKVKSRGEITFNNQSFYIGEGYKGRWVGLRKYSDQKWEVFFCWKSLGFIDFAKTTKGKYNYERLRKRV